MQKFLWIKFLCHVECRWIHQVNNKNDRKYEERPENVRQGKLHKQVPPGQAPIVTDAKLKRQTATVARESGDIHAHTVNMNSEFIPTGIKFTSQCH